MEANKENKVACFKLIGNFQSLRYFKLLTPESLKIMAEALVKSCRDLDHAAKVVETWLEGNQEHPTPADLHRLAREMSGAETYRLPAPCDRCTEIPGYIQTEVILKSSLFAGEVRSALALCGCARGKALGEAALRSRKESPVISSWRPPEKEDFTPLGMLV